MSIYFLVVSRSPWENNEVYGVLDLAEQLGRDGHRVDLLLIQNGVLLAQEAVEPRFRRLMAQPDMHVWVDGFSLQSRALPLQALPAGMQVIEMEQVVRLLTRPGCKPIWY